MSSLQSISDYKAYHILSYGSLLGATLFQSFIGGVVAYKALPRPQFSTLQQKTFPIFFALQSALPLVLVTTYPGEKLLGIGGEYIRENVGFGGVMAPSNRWSVLGPLATMLVTAVLNLVLVGPATTKSMKERHHQETRDGKKSYDAGPHSQEMQKLNRSFATLHTVSTLLNLAGFGAMIYYGFVLGERL
ncbi:hypothetical protein MBLNU459_g1681t1 [Dothideomycetes sp. NU459]